MRAVKKAADENAGRRNDDAHFMRMFGLRDVQGLGEDKSSGNDLDKFKYNIGRSVVNTAAAHIGSKRPKPKFQTDDADWSLVQKAQACEQAVKGIFTANDMYGLGHECFVDSAVSSIGGVHIFSEDGVVRIERVFPGEVLVDVREGMYGKPRTIYRVKALDRTVVDEKWPDKRGEQHVVGSGVVDNDLMRFFDWFGRDNVTDQVLVVEAWHIGPVDKRTGKRNGRHIIATGNRVLLLETWTRDRAPLVFFRFSKRQVGFYGCGIIEELRGHQRAINYLNLKIADAMHRNSRSTLLIPEGPKGKKVAAHQITNNPADYIEIPYGASAPMQLTVSGVPTDWFNYRREIIEDAYAQVGVSQLRATGQVPKGLESGIAIREAEDVGAQRFADVVQRYERFFVDVARECIEELREMAEDGDIKPIATVVRKGSRARVELIDWRDVALEDHQYTLEVTPASALPDSTAGRTQTVTDWLQAGLIDQQSARALLDHPDLERFKSLDLSAYEVILDTIESIVDDGKYYPPEPTDDLQLAIKLATQSYNKFRLRHVQRERLDLLLQYLDDCKSLMDMAAQAAPQAAPQAVDPQVAAAQAMQAGGAPVAAMAA